MKSSIRTFALAILVAVVATACPHCAFATSTATSTAAPPPTAFASSGKHIKDVTIEMVLSVLLP